MQQEVVRQERAAFQAKIVAAVKTVAKSERIPSLNEGEEVDEWTLDKEGFWALLVELGALVDLVAALKAADEVGLLNPCGFRTEEFMGSFYDSPSVPARVAGILAELAVRRVIKFPE